MNQSLLTALGAAQGIVCLVGAGGKKSTMYALAGLHPGRVLLSSTSHMYPYARGSVDDVVMLEDANAPLPATDTGRVVAIATHTGTPHRVGAVAPERILEIYRTRKFDLCLIKADGARARWIKTPGEHEPVIPDFAATVIPVVSARVVGRPLDERIAHRPERLAALLGIEPGATIEAKHVSTLLSHPHGSLKGVGAAEVVPLINMVDDEYTRVVAREIAEAALARSDRISRIVLACMKRAQLVEVVQRGAG